MGRDQRLVGLFKRSVHETMAEVERYAAVRVRAGGRNESATARALAWAAFTHDISRELDPSVHVHVPIFNATVDYLGQHRPLEANELFARQSLFSAVLDSKLAQGARELGYQVEYTDKGPELSGVPPAVRTQFS